MQQSVKDTRGSATSNAICRANGKSRANRTGRFEPVTIKINGETLHTIMDLDSGQYCAVTYKHAIDAELEADFLNAADAKLARHAAHNWTEIDG